MKKDIKVSIIVAVYNAELYLRECIESLLNQTYYNLEIILINDGAKDKSDDICKKYAKEDKRIVYYEQKNSGVSKTRNRGIELATGELMMFVDSDDYLDVNVIETLVKNYKAGDLLCFGYKKMYIDFSEIVSCESKTESLNKNSIILNGAIKGYLWNKVFETDIIKENNIIFDENINFCEDLLFVTKYIKHCKKLKYISNIYYNYRIRKSSVTGTFCTIKNISALKSYEIVIKEFSGDEMSQNEMIYEYLFSYFRLKKIIKKEKQIKVREDFLKLQSKVLKNKNVKEKVKFIMVKYCPALYEIVRGLKKKNMYD